MSRAFTLLKWGALARGIWRGLTYKAPIHNMSSFGAVLKQLYIEPIREELNSSSIFADPLFTDQELAQDITWGY